MECFLIALALSILRIAWPYLFVVAFLGWAYSYVWNRGARSERVNTDAVKQEFANYKTAQQKLVTAITMQWDAKRIAAESLEYQLQQARDEKFAALSRRASGVIGPRVVLQRDVVGLLADSSRAANAARATASDSDATAAVPAAADASYEPAELARFFVASAAAYADAYGKWLACVKFYQSLRIDDERKD